MGKALLNIAQIFGVISGKKDNFTLENRLFNVAALIVCITGIVGITWNAIIGMPTIFNIIIAPFILVFLVLYYYARFKKRFSSLIFVLVALLGLSFLWIVSDGSKGSTPMLYIIGIIVFTSLSKSRYHLFYLLLTVLNIVVLILVENLYGDKIFASYQDHIMRENDIRFGLATSFLIGYSLISYLKSRYDIERLRLEVQSVELQKLNATKDKLFSIIAHDLRGPLNSILGLMGVMSDRNKNFTVEKLQDYAEITKSSADRAYTLLENLLSWARVNQGLLPFNPETIPLENLVQNCIATISKMAMLKDIQIEIDISSDITVQADKSMLESVFRNLVSNSIKFTHKGGIISISAKREVNEKVIVTVADNGIGMPEEMVENLFAIEYQTNRPGTKGETSSGLGLILCKEFITKMNGEIWVESKVDVGSKFSFSLRC